ncbi:isopeptide-forming domain-containing fimbrial protein [Collinsella aerofaciens]|uniref:isopeptide-forming domain-containing fimbrial protein n=3 Tax=Collinsella aerofaciens TaxID=74426 RepID=UPI00232C4EB2|nr:isopeptide-forming domain-containing fimbrial protein [Collinsella aerofaciens]MDB1819648.1 isopeptide-forming domain-containing fimbrial protein [Collinsella aerofaciens]
MKTTKNIARLAVTAGLTAALSFGGVMAPVTMAFAEGDNTITISQADKNGTTKFKAYQIFRAKVVDQNESKVASDINWANDETEKAVIGVLKQVAAPNINDSSTAEDVADYLAQNVRDTTDKTCVKNSDLLYKIADAVAKNSTQTGTSFDAGTTFTAPSNGYYLFVTDVLDASKPNTGTSPIFALVGGKSVTVTEKTSIPTVTKKVKDNKSNSNWADKADSQMGQNVNYQLTGTVADNVASFSAYKYEFYDELSAGLTADEGSIKVYAGTDRDTATAIAADNNYTADVTADATTGKSTLTVKFTDLKTAVADLSAQTKIYVEYTAKLDPKKDANIVVGGNGNENTVKLVYSNNPMAEGTGTSVSDTVRDYTYALKLIKEDSAKETIKLEGVRFSIQATEPDDSNSKGLYVQEDGSLGPNEHEFTTDKNGEINVKGLDAGTYTVKETHALDVYNTLPKFTLTISASGLNQDEGNNTLTVSATKGESDLVLDPVGNGGTVTLTVKNKKGSGLPLTGLNGVTFTWIAGGAVLCIGVAHLIRSRKQAEESEQE